MALVEAGVAKIQALEPVLTVRLIGIETVCLTLVPQDCKHFKHEVIISCEKVRTGKPFGITSQEYIELQRLLGDTYTPSSHRDRQTLDH